MPPPSPAARFVSPLETDRLRSEDFRRVASFMLSNTGIRLTESKRIMVESRLRRRVRATGSVDLADYIERTLESDDHGEVDNLINAITTNKTDFFREPSHFDFIVESVLPEIVARGRRGKFWSAACSTGAEPYTLAMTLADFAVARPSFSFSIVASDISTEVLATARRGVYPVEMTAPIPEPLARRYVMLANDPKRNEARIAPEIRAMIDFQRINLVDRRYPVEHDLDVILCRNLLIYFGRETTARVVDRLCSHLRPGGHLILGHSDSVAGIDLPARPIGRSIFKRI